MYSSIPEHLPQKSILQRYFTESTPCSFILIFIKQQTLYHYTSPQKFTSYPISSALNGVGNIEGSGQTPIGAHRISDQFGDNCPSGAIFKARETKGEIATINSDNNSSGKDYITSRILWLDGLEHGINKGHDKHGNLVDTKQRYIYIHGTHEEGLIGTPVSHGCIRMNNQDVIDLFDHCPVNTLVYIDA